MLQQGPQTRLTWLQLCPWVSSSSNGLILGCSRSHSKKLISHPLLWFCKPHTPYIKSTLLKILVVNSGPYCKITLIVSNPIEFEGRDCPHIVDPLSSMCQVLCEGLYTHSFIDSCQPPCKVDITAILSRDPIYKVRVKEVSNLSKATELGSKIPFFL